MVDNLMFNREVEPTEEYFRQLIGKEVLPVWEDTQNYLRHEHPSYSSEMIYYNPQRGWGLRYRNKLQQLCFLFPEKRGFTAFITLNPREEQSILNKKNYFNTRIRELLYQPSSLPHGRLLWLRIEDHTDFVGFKIILDCKVQ